MKDFLNSTVVELAKVIASGARTAEEVLVSYISQAEEKSHLNALLFLDEIKEEAIQKAKRIDLKIKNKEAVGKLAGVPFIVKDNIETQGISTTNGSKTLEGFKPKQNSPVVQKLIDEDAIILAKANMHECAFGITSLNAAYGDVKNPNDPSKIAGGSSGGTAAGVAANMAPFGLGTDTGGSTRIPPALNGLVGFRPTLLRYSQENTVPISSSRDTIGLITKNMEDTILIDSVVKDYDKDSLPKTEVKGLRLGILKEYFFQNLSVEVEELIHNALDKLSRAGVELVEVSIDNLFELTQSVSFQLVLSEAKAIKDYFIKNEIPFELDDFLSKLSSADVKGVYQNVVFGPPIEGLTDAETYKDVIENRRPALIKAIENCYKTFNIEGLLFPMTPLEACAISEAKEGVVTYNTKNGLKQIAATQEGDHIFGTYIQNADPGSTSGMPGITIPMGKTSNKLDVGLGLDGLANNDLKILSIGLQLEQILNAR